MGRKPTKAVGNVWYEARIRAAEYNDKLQSRAGAAEELGVSEDAIKGTELGLEKCMPVDKAVLMADLYHAPQLLNHYCLNECPIGRNRPISDQVVTVDRAAVKLFSLLQSDKVKAVRNLLLKISEDGHVTSEDEADLAKVVDYLDSLSRVACELHTLQSISTGE